MLILERIWNDIRRGENIDLYVTVIVALGLSGLNLMGLAPQTLLAPITLAVLGLVAISTLGTRHHIEELSLKLTTASEPNLKERSQIPSFKERGQTASEIVVVGVSSISAVVPHLDFFEQKMRDGCRLRFLLLNPSSPSLETWNLISKVPNTKADIELCLRSLEVIKQMDKTKGKCEVRLANVFLPFGLAAFDPEKETGFMTVELHIYKRTLGERPHIRLTRARDKKWFEFFKSQYEQIWSDSTEWNPKAS